MPVSLHSLRSPGLAGVFLLWALGGCEYVMGGIEDQEPSGDAAVGTDSGRGSGTDDAGADESGPADGEGETDTGADPGASPDATGDTGGSDGGLGGACCDPSGLPGCGDPSVEACVCESDPYCCEVAWDVDCAGKVERLGCGFCGQSDDGFTGTCCTASTSPGCGDAEIEACVCALDPLCCSQDWDALCVDLLVDSGCGTCEGGVQTCCEAMDGPGCAADAEVEACVCDAAPECCSEAWTQTCGQLVSVLGCAVCGPSEPEPQECCHHGAGGGCSEVEVESCVCAVDPYCCQVLWDDQCVAAVDDLACGSC
jgi:hypothetical protein